MSETEEQKILALEKELEHLKNSVMEIHDLSADLINGGHVAGEHVAKKIRDEIERLRVLVYTDELTHIANRRGFFDRVQKDFQHALDCKRGNEKRKQCRVKDLSILFVDCDDFKKINDTFGHDEGDRILIAVADVLTRSVRKTDTVARFGGEEFVVALVGVDERYALRKAEEIRNSLTQNITIGDGTIQTVTASIGVASLSASDADELDALVGYADKAMYEAKTHRGKNAVVRWSELKQ